MIEIFSEWVIIGACGIRYGSFNDRERAIEYAGAIQVLRQLTCRVVHRNELEAR